MVALQHNVQFLRAVWQLILRTGEDYHNCTLTYFCLNDSVSLHLDCDSNGVCPDHNKCPVCQHGGSCQDVIDGYSCQCMLGYTGVHCETNIDECQGVDCKVSQVTFNRLLASRHRFLKLHTVTWHWILICA